MAADAIIRVKTAVDNADLKQFGKEFVSSTKQWGSIINNVTSSLTRMAGSLLFLKAITSGISKLVTMTKEGFKNLAQYSKDYNRAMSDLMSRSEELKNNLAAAFEPIVLQIIPYLTKFVEWLNTAAESVSMFLAVMSGKNTYTKASKQMMNYANAVKSATKALASFDKLNVLSKSGSGAKTGANAFEEGMIDPATLATLQKVKQILEQIKPIAEIIGAILLGWKIGSALASLGVIGAVLAVILGSAIAIYSYFKMWEDGVSWETLAGYVLGVTIAVVALYTAFGPFVAGLFLVIAGVAGVVLALKDMKKNGMNAENMFLLLASATAAALGVTMAFGIVAGTVTAGVLVLAAGIAALCLNWNKMDGAQKAITILGALAAALTTAAIAVAIFHTCWTVGVAAAGIAAGLALLGLTYYFTKGQGETRASSNSRTMPESAKNMSKKDFTRAPIPALADGAVIQGGSPFMAWLGDQPNGQTNIETPLATMVQAFKQAMAETGGGNGPIQLEVNLDGDVVYKNVVSRDRMYQRSHGGASAFF